MVVWLLPRIADYKEMAIHGVRVVLASALTILVVNGALDAAVSSVSSDAVTLNPTAAQTPSPSTNAPSLSLTPGTHGDASAPISLDQAVTLMILAVLGIIVLRSCAREAIELQYCYQNNAVRKRYLGSIWNVLDLALILISVAIAVVLAMDDQDPVWSSGYTRTHASNAAVGLHTLLTYLK